MKFRGSAPALLLLLGTLALANTTTPGEGANACGRSDGIGAFYQAQLSDGTFTLTLNLTDAPTFQLDMQPLLFIDGVLQQPSPEQALLTLTCGRESTWQHRVHDVQHVVHWSLAPQPFIDPALENQGIDRVWEAFADQPLPQREGWVQVSPLTLAHVAPTTTPARHQPLWGHPAIGTATAYGGDAGLWEDGVVWIGNGQLDAANVTSEGTLARARIGDRQPFMVRFLPGTLGAGAMALTCLLNDQQIPAFEGALLAPAVARANEAVRWLGSVDVQASGWQRLHCYLLPDAMAEGNEAWPRPLMAAYLWVDP